MMMARKESVQYPPVCGCVYTDIAHLVAQIEAKLQQTKESRVFQWASGSGGQKAALREVILQNLVRLQV